MGLIATLAKSASALAQRRDAKRAHANADAGNAERAYAHLGEEEEFQFDSLGGLLSFLFPVPSHSLWVLSVVLQGVVTGCVCFGAFFYMLPSDIEARYQKIKQMILYMMVINMLVTVFQRCQCCFSKFLDG